MHAALYLYLLKRVSLIMHVKLSCGTRCQGRHTCPYFLLLSSKDLVSMHRCAGSGADPGFLEREFICIKGWEFAFLILSPFS